jgi:hypothetical protein
MNHIYPGKKALYAVVCLVLASCGSSTRTGADVAELRSAGTCRQLVVKRGSWSNELVCPEDLSFLPLMVGSQIVEGFSPQGVAMMVEPRARVTIRYGGKTASVKADSDGLAAIEVDSEKPIDLIMVIAKSGQRWECRAEQNFNCYEG